MLLPDVNVLVYAHREDADNHLKYRAYILGHPAMYNDQAILEHVPGIFSN